MSFWKATKLLLTLHCEESTELMSAELDHHLSTVERWAVRLHLLVCRSCRKFRRQLLFLHEAARRRAQSPAATELPTAVRENVLRQLFPPRDQP